MTLVKMISGPESNKLMQIINKYASKIIVLLDEIESPSADLKMTSKVTLVLNTLVACLYSIGGNCLPEDGHGDEEYINNIATALRQYLRDLREGGVNEKK